MTATVQDVQRRLIALGFPLPKYGVDGSPGAETWAAVDAALDALVVARGGAEPTSAPGNTGMTVSATGRKAIRQHEGEMLAAYQDSVGVWTIGVGHTSAAGAPKVTKGLTITAAQSDEILSRDLRTFEEGVLAAVKVSLAQHEFDALVSLAFNIGIGAFGKSTLLRKLNAGDRAGAADQFLVWNKAGGKVLKGLVTRRAAERKMFLGK